MTPCLCGDPACGSCFPSGQNRVRCICEGSEPLCTWKGKLYDACMWGDGLTEPELQCPECGCPCIEDDLSWKTVN
jgi:hypothetical protein